MGGSSRLLQAAKFDFNELTREFGETNTSLLLTLISLILGSRFVWGWGTSGRIQDFYIQVGVQSEQNKTTNNVSAVFECSAGHANSGCGVR